MQDEYSYIMTDEDYKQKNEDIKRFLVNIIEDCILNLTGILPATNVTEYKNEVQHFARLHFWLNQRTRKVYIEYDFCNDFQKIVPVEKIASVINNRINTNMHEWLCCYPEILMREDGRCDICDCSPLLTPYTIGYWKSLAGSYRFIDDEVEVMNDAINFANPSDEISGGKPKKKIEDFFAIVEGIRSKYLNKTLSNKDKELYIKEFMELKRSDEDYPEQYKALNDKYSIKTDINSKVPDMFKDYEKAYVDFFESLLPPHATVENDKTYYISYFNI